MDQKIKEINALALEYSKSAVSLVTDLSSPFLNAIGANTFLYGRIFYNGKYILLSNNIEWVECWYQNINTIQNTFLQKKLQNTLLGGEPLYSLWATAHLKDHLMKIHNRCGIWHGFDISYRLEDSVEGWCFTSIKEQEKKNQFYLNNLKLFHRFCLYFREKAASLLDIKEKSQLAVFKEASDISFHPTPPFEEDVNVLLNLLPLDGYSLKTPQGSIKLTKRELECLYCLSRGKTAKEIGRFLNISPRTVETYCTNLKNKTNYHNLSEFADIFMDNVLKWL